ncbi:hypothetical protein AZE42_06792 [Rhizopogon vesiculosus]|uniref:Uncharacterized protein n=1 Tax=Rhizopogon vesiculosus TaxID=180088 RepID=A0A1J8Q8P7_9AGAM|nr:hypothetical protein AZE42_06792 [Rhizopogon vesiculosus]
MMDYLHKLGWVLGTPVSSGFEIKAFPTGYYSSNPSIMDELGLPFVAVLSCLTCGLTTGASNGGLDIGNGTADAVQGIISQRPKATFLSLMFAASASAIMLGSALHMTRAFDAFNDTQAAIPDTGALQLLWLGHHSAPVLEILEDVKDPTDAVCEDDRR